MGLLPTTCPLGTYSVVAAPCLHVPHIQVAKPTSPYIGRGAGTNQLKFGTGDILKLSTTWRMEARQPPDIALHQGQGMHQTPTPLQHVLEFQIEWRQLATVSRLLWHAY